jgi:DNA-binding Lrp family transcriptional regulator
MVDEMVIGVIFIDAATGKEHDVYKELEKDLADKKPDMPHLTSLYLMFEEYDVGCIARANNYEQLGRYVVDRVRAIEGVVSTRIYTGVELPTDKLPNSSVSVVKD